MGNTNVKKIKNDFILKIFYCHQFNLVQDLNSFILYDVYDMQMKDMFKKLIESTLQCQIININYYETFINRISLLFRYDCKDVEIFKLSDIHQLSLEIQFQFILNRNLKNSKNSILFISNDKLLNTIKEELYLDLIMHKKKNYDNLIIYDCIHKHDHEFLLKYEIVFDMIYTDFFKKHYAIGIF